MTTLQDLPGPRTPGLFNSLELAFAPRKFALRHTARHGRAFRVPSLLGPILYTSNVEHVKRIFAADSGAFDTFQAATFSAFLGPRSVFVSAGKLHKRQRKLLSPPLNGTRLRALGARIEKLAEHRVNQLRPGQRLRALDLATAFTLDVIVAAVFGVEEEAEQGELLALLGALVNTIPVLTIFAPSLRHPWFRPWARYRETQLRFEAWLTSKIARRRADGARGPDVLSLLLDARCEDGTPLDDGEIRDQLVTLLLAGHETTAVTVTSCLERLHRHPEVLARLRAELSGAKQGADVQRLPYLSAVLNETLRIDPIVPEVGRVSNADLALDDALVVKAGELVVVLIEALHHDPELYPEPATFRPARFLERSYAPYEYAPFGGGVRRCLGAAFTDYESKILLATLLDRVTFELEDSRPEPRARRNATMGPKHGVPLRVLAVR
jgi:cytochrome P450